ncbi:MAG: hypothetical protein AAFQ87_19015 [Bacteroidota bacterium]
MKTLTLLLLGCCWQFALLAQFTQVGSQLDGNAPNDNFGWDVASNQSGKIIAVGAPLYDDDFGQVRVYQQNNGAWAQLGGDIEGNSIGNQYGFSLALNAAGDRLAIGGIGGQPGNGGQVAVFSLEAGNWVALGDTMLAESAGDQFGYSLDMNDSGDRLVVGARNNDGNGAESGSVRVFALQNNTWTQLGGDLDGDNPNDGLGESVGMNAAGDIIAAGSVNRNGGGFNSGQIKVWQWDGSSWIQLGSDIFGGGNGEFLGGDLDLSDDGLRVISGATGHDHGMGFGSVRVYEFTNGSWTQVGSDVRGSSATEAFGQAVSINGDGSIIAVGTQSADDVSTSSGRVNIFRLENGNWVEQYTPILGQAQFDNLGKSVALNQDGNRFVIGANLANGTQGYAVVYQDSQMPVSLEQFADQLGVQLSVLAEEQWIEAGFAERQTWVQMRLFDLQGQKVAEKRFAKQAPYRLSYGERQGVYLLEISTSADSWYQKVWLR